MFDPVSVFVEESATPIVALLGSCPEAPVQAPEAESDDDGSYADLVRRTLEADAAAERKPEPTPPPRITLGWLADWLLLLDIDDVPPGLRLDAATVVVEPERFLHRLRETVLLGGPRAAVVGFELERLHRAVSAPAIDPMALLPRRDWLPAKFRITRVEETTQCDG